MIVIDKELKLFEAISVKVYQDSISKDFLLVASNENEKLTLNIADTKIVIVEQGATTTAPIEINNQ